MESNALRFAEAARVLGEVTHRYGATLPDYRTPPRAIGCRRTIRRRPDGSCSVAIVVRDRPWVAVLADMVDAVLAANPAMQSAESDELRDALWASVVTEDAEHGFSSAA